MRTETKQHVNELVLAPGLSLARGLDLFTLAMEGIKSPATISWYRAMLQPLVGYLGDVDLEAITIDDLRQWRATLNGRKLKPSTLSCHVRACRTFFTWLVGEEKLTASPAERLELPPKAKAVRKGIGEDDRAKMLAAIVDPRCVNQSRDLAMIHFLDDSACRAGGIVGLTLDRLDVGERYAWAREKGLGGERKERKVFFSPQTAALLAAWLDQRPDCDCENVFVSPEGEPLSVKGLYRVLRRLAKRAGVKRNWSAHNWRHATIRRMKKRGVNLAVMSQLAGHSTVQLTGDLYGTLDEAELQAAVDGVLWEMDGADPAD